MRDAVRGPREKTQTEKFHHPRAMADAGHEQLLFGEGEALMAGTMNEILRQAKKDHKNGKPAKDEIKA